MIETVAPADFIPTFAVSAAIVLFGAAYAALFAYSRIRPWPWLHLAAGLSYAALALSVQLLSRLAHLDGHWRVVAALMLIGYLAAPWAIWKLCVASHGEGGD